MINYSKYVLFMLFCLWIAYAFTGCTKEATPPVVKEVKAIEIKMHYGFWPNQGWTEILSDQLDKFGADILKFEPKDKDLWCMGSDKKAFYIRLISAMAKYESSWNPNTTYKENFKDQRGANVVSVGLLQVSQESCGGYGMKVTTEQLKDASKNLECTVRILNRWIPRDGYIGKDKLGAGRYWSVMRPGAKKDAIKKLICK